jgi:hypothetical protein
MKTSLKAFLLGLAITASIAACSGNKGGGSADSSRVDSSTSVKIDSTITVDTIHRDTARLVADTPKLKIDTLSKTTFKKAVVKKVVIKKP